MQDLCTYCNCDVVVYVIQFLFRYIVSCLSDMVGLSDIGCALLTCKESHPNCALLYMVRICQCDWQTNAHTAAWYMVHVRAYLYIAKQLVSPAC